MENALISLVSGEKLSDVLRTLNVCVGLPVLLIDPEGAALGSFGEPSACCLLLRERVFQGGECREMHRKVGRRALDTGDSYIFSCRAGLNHICYSLQDHNRLLASVLVGPFLMDRADSTLVGSLMEHYPMSVTLALDLYDELNEVPVIEPARVGHLSRLVRYLLGPLLPEGRAQQQRNREILFQQSRINESIQRYKGDGKEITMDPGYLREKERNLLGEIKTGDTRRVKGLLNDLLGYVLFSEGGRIERVRIRAMELATLLSRVAMDRGAMAEDIYELNDSFVRMISRGQSIDELCYLLQDLAECFMNAMFSPMDKGNAYVRSALAYAASNYMRPITLQEIAGHAGLSANYFSRLFRENVGTSFREHLNRVRVEESKHLLNSTRDSLADIALAVGFADQSYYSKVFKRIVGLPPGKYRG